MCFSGVGLMMIQLEWACGFTDLDEATQAATVLLQGNATEAGRRLRHRGVQRRYGTAEDRRRTAQRRGEGLGLAKADGEPESVATADVDQSVRNKRPFRSPLIKIALM